MFSKRVHFKNKMSAFMEDEDDSGSITESEYVSATDLESEDDEFSGPCAYSHNEDDEEPKKHRNGVSSEAITKFWLPMY